MILESPKPDFSAACGGPKDSIALTFMDLKYSTFSAMLCLLKQLLPPKFWNSSWSSACNLIRALKNQPLEFLVWAKKSPMRVTSRKRLNHCKNYCSSAVSVFFTFSSREDFSSKLTSKHFSPLQGRNLTEFYRPLYRFTLFPFILARRRRIFLVFFGSKAKFASIFYNFSEISCPKTPTEDLPCTQ